MPRTLPPVLTDKTGHDSELLSDGPNGLYQVVCDCGWKSSLWWTPGKAMDEGVKHLLNAAPIKIPDSWNQLTLEV